MFGMRFIDNVLKCRAYFGKYVLPCVGAPHRHRVFGEIQKSGDVPGAKRWHIQAPLTGDRSKDRSRVRREDY